MSTDNPSGATQRPLIRAAEIRDLPQCLAIEESLREDRPEAAFNGFLLSGGGDTPQTYEEFVSYGAFLVATVSDSIVGFAFALPPDSPRMQRLRAAEQRFSLHREQDVFRTGELAWLAKVGIREDFMRRGIATALYQALFHLHPHWHFLTTTVREPLRNAPSERLHDGLGFACIGELPLGNRGVLQNIVCKVYYRRPSLS